MTNIDWKNAPDQATHYYPGDATTFPHWLKIKDGVRYFLMKSNPIWQEVEDYGDPLLSSYFTKPEDWSGEGLPPVGIFCEVNYRESWHKCEIIAHFKQPAGMMAAFTVEYMGNIKSLDAFTVGNFRPIKTPEQIKAEQRSKALEEMVYGACGADKDGSNTHAFILCGLLYDAGYRKSDERR